MVGPCRPGTLSEACVPGTRFSRSAIAPARLSVASLSGTLVLNACHDALLAAALCCIGPTAKGPVGPGSCGWARGYRARVPQQVYWPPELHELWERIFPCIDCRSDPELTGKIPWDQYVPLKTIGILPPGRPSATYLVLAAEPAGAGNVKDRESSIERQRGPNGVRNFNGTRSDLALQFALERWLIDQEKDESYYITDLAKCRVPTGHVAGATAERRYANCARWLELEFRILRPRAIIAVGRSAFRGAVRQRRPDWPAVFEIGHYGAAGVRWWKEYLDDGWEARVPETTDLDRFAQERRPLSLHQKEIRRFTESYRWLLVMYRTQLGAIRDALDAAPFAVSAVSPVKIPGSKGMRALYSARA